MFDTSYLSTGEFAKACGITKDTLFHYDRIGLLKPEKVLANGYRLYSPRQILQIGLIQTMQTADCSLTEISSYMVRQSPSQYLEILEEKEKLLALKIRQLQYNRHLLREAARITKEAMNAVYEKPFLHEEPKAALLASPLDPEGGEKENLIRMGQHYAYCVQKKIPISWPNGCIILKEHLSRGIFHKPDLCFDTLHGTSRDPRVHIKKEGLYLSIYHKGSYSTLPSVYEILFAYMKAQHLTLEGPSYEQELINFFAEPNTHRYVIRIDLAVGSQ